MREIRLSRVNFVLLVYDSRVKNALPRQKELEKYLHKIEDLTGTPPTSLKKVKDGAGATPGGSALTTTGTKPKDSNLIDNLGQGT